MQACLGAGREKGMRKSLGLEREAGRKLAGRRERLRGVKLGEALLLSGMPQGGVTSGATI